MKIICLIACHVSAPEHLVYFGEMLNSVIRQTSTSHRVLISISKDPKQSYPNITKDLINNIEIYLQDTKLSQFEHYSKLMPKLEHENPHTSWVCFGDADDLWHHDRIKLYQDVATQFADNVTAIMAGHHLIGPYFDSSVSKDNPLRIFTEHWNLCVRLFFVRYFLQLCPPVTKNHKFCDVLFSQWIRSMSSPLGMDRGTASFDPQDKDNWMYFYRTHKLSITGAIEEKSGFPCLEDALVNNIDHILAVYRTNERAKDEFNNQCKKQGLDRHNRVKSKIIEIWNKQSEKSVFNPNKLTDLFPTKCASLSEYFTEKSTNVCSYCKMLDVKNECGKCGVRYCNREHQVLDWHKHKTLCDSILVLEPYWQYEEYYVKVIGKLVKVD